jgi:hypothetical protein
MDNAQTIDHCINISQIFSPDFNVPFENIDLKWTVLKKDCMV